MIPIKDKVYFCYHIQSIFSCYTYFPKFYIFLTFWHIDRSLNITNITPQIPVDGSVEPKRYSVDFISQ